ncbi:hypothetical protein D918_00266 [Trichuris suis]|nr:hypothetical protein D918_00266 [Trichuris suis]
MAELFKQPMVLDGSMGTRLVELGCNYIEDNPLWSAAALLKDPQKVVQAHSEYLTAGAKVLETNTYQCALSNLVKYCGISREAAQDVLRLGIQLARQAIESHCVENNASKRDFFVAGSVGPYATVLHDGSEYNGRYIDTVQPELITDYFSGQVEVLCSAGVDCLAIETLPSLREAKLAIDVVSKLCSVPTWISFSCKEGCLTNYGDAFCDVIAELDGCCSIAAIGINCTDPKVITKLLSCASSRKLVVVYPNSGFVHGTGTRKVGLSFATYANEWLRHGAKLIGGCCFTGPQEIAEVANVVYDNLYVGDLHPDVSETNLFDRFSTVGPLVSVRVCRDSATVRSLGYAYVNFRSRADAKRAMDTLNFDVLMGRPMRIMWSQRDPSQRRSGVGNIFIKNLERNIGPKTIYETYSNFGNILSCKVAVDQCNVSKGYGFVHFETEESAQKAITQTNGMLMNDKKVYVGKFVAQAQRGRHVGESTLRFKNVHAKNFKDC